MIVNKYTKGGGDIDLSGFYTSAQTEERISSAYTILDEHITEVEQVTASAFTELHDDIIELSGRTGGNSPIIPAITTQAEYEAISGDVKTGDLIEVEGVVLDGYDGPQYGLFGATVEEEEYEGVVRKLITWARRDNMNSVYWSVEDYPWMPQNDVQPIELGQKAFLISPDMAAEDEAYNGIGFDADGKPVITHFSPEYDDETGEVTGITREDTPIGGGSTEDIELPIAAAVNDLKNNIEARLDQQYYKKQEVLNLVRDKLTAAQVSQQIVDVITPLFEAVYDAIENKELAISAAINDLNTRINNL